MADDIATPPPGFVLDSSSQASGSMPPPPPGFEVDQDENTPPSGFQLDSQKYSTPGQQLGTMVEGAAQGVFGPLATAAELGLSKLGVPNMTSQDIIGREKANPLKHGFSEAGGFGASLLTGLGEAKAVSKIAEHFTPEAVTWLGKIGSNAINGLIQGGLFSGGNEVTKGLLDQGDPNHPVASVIANVGASSLFGLGLNALLGVGGQLGSKAAEYLSKNNTGSKVNDLLTGVGLGSASTPEQVEAYLKGDNTAWQKRGLKLYGALHSKLTQGLAGGVLANALPYGNDTATDRVLKDVAGTVAGAYLGPKVYDMVGKGLAPVIYKILGSGNPQGAEDSINYALKAMQGSNKISKGLDSLFDYGTSKAVDYIDPGKNIDSIKEWIKNGGADYETQQEANQTSSEEEPQSYAIGGEVNNESKKPSGIATHFPEQNILLNAAKGRVSRFLGTVRPIPTTNKLPYDSDHKSPQKEHEYDQFVRLAQQPLTILNKIKDGSLNVAHAGAFKSMYPELHQVLSQKMREHIIKNHVDENKRPPYHMRQAMSLFLGQNLESTLIPANIQAAQNTFVMQKTQQNPTPNSKSELSKIGQSAQTADQARQQRSNKS